MLRALAWFGSGLACSLVGGALHGDDWPQWRGPRRDGVWRESGVIEKFEGPEIKARWRAEVAGGYCGPTVAEGRVYVSDRVTAPEEQEPVHCLDAVTGRKIWTHVYACPYGKVRYTAGPRASITVDRGCAYALGATGRLFCLNAATGVVLWQKDLEAAFQIRMPTWGIAAAPLIEDDLAILQIGGDNGECVVALDRKTGEERWRALDDPASYSAPIAVDQAGRRVVVCWTGTRLVGLDAQSGKLYWAHEVGYTKWVIAIATPVLDNRRLLISAVDQGSSMLRLVEGKPAIEELWLRRGQSEPSDEGLHCLMCTPLIKGDHIYGADGYGVLRCLDARSGDRVWEDHTATTQIRWGMLHMVQNGDRTWMFNDRGELIISRLTPQGFEEISRAKLIKPTLEQLRRRDGVCWSHPAFAGRHVFARNDEEVVCASLAAEGGQSR